MAESLLATATSTSGEPQTTVDSAGTQPAGQPDGATAAQPSKQDSTTEPKAEPPKAEPKDDPKAKAPDKTVPETYEFKLPKGMPEGATLDENVSKAFSEVARDLKLTQEKAQKVIDAVVPVMHAREQQREADARNEWVRTLRNDPEIGGSKLNENLSLAHKVFATFGSADLNQVLRGSLGDYPELVRFAVNIGKAISPDRFVQASGAASSRPTDPEAALAHAMYGQPTK